ncbi:MAG: hypothetical protein Q4C96_06920 [Planctomycetia bacterium]|nr:hypothetical protein [Planctomycetia bacterium]
MSHFFSRLLPKIYQNLRHSSQQFIHLLLPETCHFCHTLLRDQVSSPMKTEKITPYPTEHTEKFLQEYRTYTGYHSEFSIQEAKFPENIPLCQQCMEALRPQFVQRCPWCGTILREKHFCHEKIEFFDSRNMSYDHVFPLDDYRDMLREAVLKMKNYRYEALSHSMGKFYCYYREKELKNLRLDFIIPVPMHGIMKFIRKVNSADILADILGNALELPVLHHLVRYNRLTRLQRSLPMAERRKNVAGCFSIRYPFPTNLFPNMQKRENEIFRKIFKNRRALIVDDVLTTGATCGEISRILKEELGLSFIAVAVLAKARGEIPDSPPENDVSLTSP